MAKVTFELDDNLDDVLGSLAKKQGLKKSQMLRRSIALMKYLEDERDDGNRVAITNGSGQVLKEIVIPT
jgi:predicted transcriptional regulator